jgi:hypothetical protein
LFREPKQEMATSLWYCSEARPISSCELQLPRYYPVQVLHQTSMENCVALALAPELFSVLIVYCLPLANTSHFPTWHLLFKGLFILMLPARTSSLIILMMVCYLQKTLNWSLAPRSTSWSNWSLAIQL